VFFQKKNFYLAKTLQINATLLMYLVVNADLVVLGFENKTGI
jgi:hypothetical protein